MDQPSFATKFYRRICCAVLFFVAASASFHGFYTKWHFREPGAILGAGETNDRHFSVGDLLDGTAARPFVYRQLLPAAANWIDAKTPQKIKDRLYHSATDNIRFAYLMRDSPMVGNPAWFFRYSVVYAAVFAFAWLAVFAMYLVCDAVDAPPAAQILAPVTMILLFPYFLSHGGYLYDYPELAFLALAVWMGLKFDWWWMLPLVALATWNKESFLLIVLTLYPILRTKTSRMGAALGTGALALTSGLVYFALRLRFQSNPGDTVLHQWRDQLNFFEHPQHLVDWEMTYGVPMFRAFSVIPLALLVWTVWRGWKLLPKPIQRHGQIAAAINLPMFFLFCQPGEMRDLSMLYMAFLVLLAVNITELLQSWNGSAKPA
jgi:hypothetical protein